MGAANFFRVVLLTAALLGSHAAREASATGGGHSEVICGGDDIWEMLMASSTVRSIQDIKWAKIQSIAGDYLSEKAAQQATLEEELKHLRIRIEEEPQETSEAELATLLAESLASFDPNGNDGLGMAAKSKCGKPTAETRAPRGAYRTSVENFVHKAGVLLTARKRFSGDAFLRLCHEQLPPGDESYCGPFCGKLTKSAQKISDSRVGAAGGLPSDELVEQMLSMERKLEQVVRDIHRCEGAKRTLAAFETQVGDLKGTQTVRLDELKEQSTAMEQDIEHMREQVRIANANCKKADQALVEALKAVKSGGGKKESSLLQGLRHQKLHAQSKVLLARKAVAESRQDCMHNRFGTITETELRALVVAVGLAVPGDEADALARDTSKLSAGERQLVTLSRALLRRVALAVLDEPTSKVDPTTDTQVQRTVRERLSEATVVTIAHRLHTIIDCDRVLVMGDGRALECGPPGELLGQPHSEMSRLADALGPAVAADLRAAAGLRAGFLASL